MPRSNQPSDPAQEIELYRNLAENACDLICQAGPTGRYTYVSPNYEQVLGYRPEELVGQSLFKLVHPDDLAYVNRRFVLGVVTHQPAQIQFRYRHKNGEWRWLETSGKPFFHGGDLWRATFISRDITQRRKMEEELQREHNFRERVLASTSNAIAALDVNGRLLLVNSRMQEITGYTEEELRDRELVSLLTSEDRDHFTGILRDVLEHENVLRWEIGILRRDHTVRRVRLSLSPLHVDGQRVGVVLTGEDLTEFHLFEKEREHLLDQLEISQKMEAVGTLAAGVAHDFNNILSSLLIGTQLLQNEFRDRPTALQLLEMQEKAINRASALTQRLLGFSRRIPLQTAPVDLAARVSDMLEFCSNQLDPRIEVRNELPTGLRPISADIAQIDQVLLNLLLNAGQALQPKLEKGKPALVTFQALEQDIPEPLAKTYDIAPGTEAVHLSIRDTGIGIPEQLRARIFEPFFTTRSAQGNHGLGLATIYRIIKNHGGAIEVESEEKVGTTFHLYFPLSVSERTSPSEHSESQSVLQSRPADQAKPASPT